MASPVRLSRLPVGSSARTIAGSPTQRPGDGDPLALAAGQGAGPVRRPGRRGRRRRARRAARASALAPRHAGVEQAVGDVLQRGQALDEVELLEHEADAPPADARRAARRARRLTSCPSMRTVPVGRSLQRADDVDQRRLPGPDGPTMTTNSPARTVRSIAVERLDRRLAGVALDDAVHLQHRRGRHGTTTWSPGAEVAGRPRPCRRRTRRARRRRGRWSPAPSATSTA